MIQTVLVSVADKTGIVGFIKDILATYSALHVLATGGTRAVLEAGGVVVTDISSVTGFPDCFDGRVKTLHPSLFGGILFRRGQDEEAAERHGIVPIDLVVCNLKPPEFMDIGGSALIRAAAKNAERVGVIVDPRDYPMILRDGLTSERRRWLAQKALGYSASYEAHVAASMGRGLRYGENPQQMASLFPVGDGVVTGALLSGKEPSYNNYEDASVAYEAVQDLLVFGQCSIAVVKHGSVCSAAVAGTLERAFQLAWEGDALSAFGSVIGLTLPVDGSLIPELQGRFVEVLIGPEFSPEFLAWARVKRPSLRLLSVPNGLRREKLYRGVSGGMLVQEALRFDPFALRVVTRRQPLHLSLATFGMLVVAHAKSNAVAVVREVEPGCFQVIGMGVGQPNRIDCVRRLALPKALEVTSDLAQCVLASDGFFPFDDCVHCAAANGIRCCVQPGGSVHDEKVIRAADELDICMLFSDQRCFSH